MKKSAPCQYFKCVRAFKIEVVPLSREFWRSDFTGNVPIALLNMKKISLLFVTLMAFGSWFFFPAETVTTYSPGKGRGVFTGERVIASVPAKPTAVAAPKSSNEKKRSLKKDPKASKSDETPIDQKSVISP